MATLTSGPDAPVAIKAAWLLLLLLLLLLMMMLYHSCCWMTATCIGYGSRYHRQSSQHDALVPSNNLCGSAKKPITTTTTTTTSTTTTIIINFPHSQYTTSDADNDTCWGRHWPTHYWPTHQWHDVDGC